MTLQVENISRQRLTPVDLLVILLATGLITAVSLSQWQDHAPAQTAVVYNNQQESQQFSLQGEHIHHVIGRLGDSELEIKNGKIRFRNSPCRQRLCIHSGWLGESGEAAACLPNGISVVLHSDNPRYDSINF